MRLLAPIDADATTQGWASAFLTNAGPRTRLVWTSMMAGLTWVLGFVHGLLTIALELPTQGMEDRLVPCATVALAASVLTWWLASSGRLPDRLLGAWGVAFGWILVLVPELLFIGIPIPELGVRAAPFSIIAMVFIPLFLQFSVRTTIVWSILVAPVPSLVVAAAPLVGAPPATAVDVAMWAAGPLITCPMVILGAMHFEANRKATERARALARDLGSYRLDHLLGKGGMGEVWRGEHRMLARPVAVKIIRPDRHLDPARIETMRQRFLEEARATSELESPHTISIFDFGVSPDQTLFYVMELLDGIDLEQLVVTSGKVAPARVVHILRQLLRSLEEAHLRGMVHRDVKPANIMLCRSALRWDHVKVLDFGIVRRLESSTMASDGHATEQGAIIGTPAFMAPEVAQGSPADPSADLYAVGCVAWYLLCGRHVFEAETPMAVALKHCSDPPDSTTRWANVPADLDALVLSLLAKAPEERPPDAGSVLAALDRLELAGAWSQDDARAWWAMDGGRRSAVPAPSRATASETWVFHAEG